MHIPEKLLSFQQQSSNRLAKWIYVSSQQYLSGFVISTSSLQNNHGGALLANLAHMMIIGSSFSDNRSASDGFGGGAVSVCNGTLVITDSFFSNNSVEANGPGGVVYVFGGRLSINNSMFWDNSAEGVGGAIYVLEGDMNISNTHFISSRADSSGGAVYISRGEVQVADSQFRNNSAGNLGGAALYIHDGKVTIISSSFLDNSADFGGCCGAVCIDSGKGVLILGSTFNDNTVVNSHGFSGGALYINDTEDVKITSSYFRNKSDSTSFEFMLYFSQLNSTS